MTTAERITDTQALIAKLDGELADAKRVEAQSRETRRAHALAAAKGDAKAARALSEAGEAAARSMLASEDLELALTAAREELAGLEAEAEQERLAGVRAQALELARERQRLGAELQAQLDKLNEAFTAWHSRGQALVRLGFENPGLYLPPNCDAVRPFKNAVPAPLREMLGLPAWVHPDDRRSVSAADPTAHLLRDAGELPPLPPEPPSLAETTLAEMNAEAQRQGPRPVVRRKGPDAGGHGPSPATNVSAEAVLAGHRVAGRTSTGGAIIERIRPDSEAA